MRVTGRCDILLPPDSQIQYNLHMEKISSLAGVYVAVVTPLKADLSPDVDGLTDLIQFLADRGCHGILMMGTTGEGPSFSLRRAVIGFSNSRSITPKHTRFTPPGWYWHSKPGRYDISNAVSLRPWLRRSCGSSAILFQKGY